MIITCPHCQTRYQVTYEAIGAAGRKVQCANCHRDWQEQAAEPASHQVDDAVFDSLAEDGLDEAMASEERAVAVEVAEHLADEERRKQGEAVAAPAVHAEQLRRRERAFLRRRKSLTRGLPMARMRRLMRVLVLGALALILVGAYFGRIGIVTRFPALAGIYEAVGLPVNVIGLDFTEVETVRSLREGREYLTVKATIAGLATRARPVPPVLVTLTDAAGQSLYQWSVTAPVRTLIVGESVDIETQLAMPPAGAKSVRLTFGERAETTSAVAAPEQNEQQGAP